MAGVREHTELDVYKLADEVRQRMREVIERPVFARDPELRDQIDQAAESPCPNIAEGFARYYPRDNARFVRFAKGSLTELVEHLQKARAKRFLSPREFDELCALIRRARKAPPATSCISNRRRRRMRGRRARNLLAETRAWSENENPNENQDPNQNQHENQNENRTGNQERGTWNRLRPFPGPTTAHPPSSNHLT